MHKALNYLSLARKAGRAELGEEPVGAAARAGKAWLILVAADASEHTWRRGSSFAEGTRQQCLRTPFSKEEMGHAVGRTSLALAAITDPALGLAFLEALDAPQTCREALDTLRERVGQVRRQQTEAEYEFRKISNQRGGGGFWRHGKGDRPDRCHVF